MDKDLNLRRPNPFKTDINIVPSQFYKPITTNWPVQTLSRGNIHNDVKYDEPIAKGE